MILPIRTVAVEEEDETEKRVKYEASGKRKWEARITRKSDTVALPGSLYETCRL